MPVSVLGPTAVAELRSRAFTYPEVGATRGAPPAGYHHLSRTITLPAGTDFARAAGLLMTWQVQSNAGLDVRASTLEVVQDAVVLMRLGAGPAGLSIPCRVVYVIDEPGRRGFAYGTLPGHPETGEESFVLALGEDGGITFTITAFSRLATLLAKLGGPVSRVIQRAMTGRYLRTLQTG